MQTKTTKQRAFPQHHFVLFWTTAICVVLFCAFIIGLYMPRHWSFQSKAELERIRTELPLAEAKWKSYNITDYDIDVQVFIHLGICTTDIHGKPTTLNVRKGNLVITDEIQNYKLEDGCGISKLLPTKLFDTVKKILENAEPEYQYLQIKFDPEYGFLSNLDITANNQISDLNVHYVFSNFRAKMP